MTEDIIFETERLYFRTPILEDAEILIPAANSIWGDIRRFMTFGQAECYDMDQAQYYLGTVCPEQLEKGALPLLGFRKDTGDFVIACGLTATDEHHVYTTGYWIPKEQQRQGFATEATNGTLHYAFNTHGAHKVIIAYYEGNAPSLRVIEKCGFEFIETKAEHALNHATGQMVDEYFYAMTRQRYLERKIT